MMTLNGTVKIKRYKDFVGFTEFAMREEKMQIKKIRLITLPRLRASRVRRKLSIGALAKKAGVTAHVTYWAEHKKAIRLDLAEKLAAALGVKLPSLRS
jgi:ribosome-binding protein aMBF1 (putative translation factor)